MQIQFNTDRHTDGVEDLAAWARGVVEQALSHASDRITRIEVHLSDQSGDRNGQHDKRCMMEARLEGRRPIAVTHQAATMDLAVNGAADKLASAIESILGRLRDQRRQAASPPDEATSPDER